MYQNAVSGLASCLMLEKYTKLTFLQWCGWIEEGFDVVCFMAASGQEEDFKAAVKRHSR
jgi:hypothetical protein